MWRLLGYFRMAIGGKEWEAQSGDKPLLCLVNAAHETGVTPRITPDDLREADLQVPGRSKLSVNSRPIASSPDISRGHP